MIRDTLCASALSKSMIHFSPPPLPPSYGEIVKHIGFLNLGKRTCLGERKILNQKLTLCRVVPTAEGLGKYII